MPDFRTGNQVAVSSATTNVSITGTVKTATVEQTAVLHDTTVMSGSPTVPSRQKGLVDWTLNLDMLFDNTASDGHDAADLTVGMAVTVAIDMGTLTWTMTTGILESYTLTNNIDGLSTVSMVVRANGTDVVIA